MGLKPARRLDFLPRGVYHKNSVLKSVPKKKERSPFMGKNVYLPGLALIGGFLGLGLRL